MQIHIKSTDVARIRAEGERTFPHECCGFLLGHEIAGARQVEEIVPVDNARDAGERHHRYTIAPDDFMRADRDARARGLDIVGFFHSHPNVAARPSDYDRENAWPWYAYLIVSVRDGTAEETTGWVLRDDRSGFDEYQVAVKN